MFKKITEQKPSNWSKWKDHRRWYKMMEQINKSFHESIMLTKEEVKKKKTNIYIRLHM